MCLLEEARECCRYHAHCRKPRPVICLDIQQCVKSRLLEVVVVHVTTLFHRISLGQFWGVQACEVVALCLHSVLAFVLGRAAFAAFCKVTQSTARAAVPEYNFLDGPIRLLVFLLFAVLSCDKDGQGEQSPNVELGKVE